MIMVLYRFLFRFVWRQSEFAFFGASTSVGALFILTNRKRRKKMKKLLIALSLIACLLFVSCKDEAPDTGNTGGGNSDVGGTGGDTETGGGEQEITRYSVTWIDENGNKLHTASVSEGEAPSYSYEVSDTAEWDYTFLGWAEGEDADVLDTIPAATKDASYYARVSRVKQKYDVIFNSMGGSDVTTQTVEYGECAEMPEEPKFEGHKFICWCLDEEGNQPADFESPISGRTEYFAIWNKLADVKGLLSALLEDFDCDPLEFIPESMLASYSENLIDPRDIVSDYSSFVSVSNIPTGHGEQWHMVLDNIMQSETFHSVLSVVDSLATTSVAIFNNYFDTNPSETAHHEFASGIYNVTVNFDGEKISYVLDYTATLPIFGEQTVQIALSMLAEGGEKSARIQIGDANALAYKFTENSYEFAIKYMGVRRAMFSVSRDEDGAVRGKIYEFLTAAGAELASAAEFYVTDDYVSVVGNKADGMMLSDNYITELYDAETGKLISYEVYEDLSSIIYNTLWFNLSDVSGINTVKAVTDADEKTDIFVNGKTKAFEAMTVGGIGGKMFSRKFDIEFRTQYVYSYDADAGKYVAHKISVPMLFIQEENYSTLSADVKTKNGIDIAISVSASDLNKLMADYDRLVPVFISAKDEITSETVIAYIGNKTVFD